MFLILDMTPRLEIANPENANWQEMQVAIRATASRQFHDRLRAIISLLKGVDRDIVCEIFMIEDRTLRRWISAFNKRGIDGLLDEKRSGRTRKIPKEKTLDLCKLLQDPQQAGEFHWTGKKFHGYLCKKLEIDIGYSTVIRFLHEQDFRLKVPQPWPEKQDEEVRKRFVDQITTLLEDESVEIWFSDESGFEADPRPKRRWTKKGKKTRVPYQGNHIRMNVIGAVCPRSGQAYMLEFNHVDTDVFQCFLDHMNRDATFERKRQIIVLDNASWHKTKSLRWGKLEPFYLPAYSPDLNPIEKLWLVIKAEWFADFIAKTKQELIDRLDQALNWVVQRTQDNQKTCAIRTKL